MDQPRHSQKDFVIEFGFQRRRKTVNAGFGYFGDSERVRFGQLVDARGFHYGDTSKKVEISPRRVYFGGHGYVAGLTPWAGPRLCL